jgi:4-hydroxybenzoate polyprenyltransferase
MDETSAGSSVTEAEATIRIPPPFPAAAPAATPDPLPTLPAAVTVPIATNPVSTAPDATAKAAPVAAPPVDLVLDTPMAPTPALRERLRWLGHRIGSTALFAELLPDAGNRLGSYARLLRLDKPIGIWLLLWPALWALWLAAKGRPDPHVFLVFLVGTVLTRSAGCAMNDFADRKYDGHVKRTRDRPLVSGKIDPIEALALCAGLGLIAMGVAMTLNQLTQMYALAGGGLIVTYPFMKRFFPLPQFYLGAAFTWSVPMAYAAQTGEVPRIAWLLFLAGVLWTMVYDTMYAMVDREDDLKLGIRSSAILFGDADRSIIGIMQLMTLLALWLIGSELEMGMWYRLGLAIAAIFALYQQSLIRERKPEDCFRAFLNNNYFGMAVFLGIALDFIFR